jgi:glycosyltransferase involved in cell wall biosynthesis
MKILLLADPNSSHVIKWANSLSDIGYEIFIFGLSAYPKNYYNKEIRIEVIDFSKTVKKTRDGNILKSVYLTVIPKLKKIIKDFCPDLLHAHSASSYGLLGALTGFHPYFISIWGGDVLIFPKKNFLYKNILKYSLNKADKLFATSNLLQKASNFFTPKHIEVIPFGVDTNLFKPMSVSSLFNEDDVVVGTIKSVDYNYGMEYLIKAFSKISHKHPNLPIKLLIVGGGSMLSEMKLLVNNLDIQNKTIFTGLIDHRDVVKYHNMLDIAVYPSVSEGFGVSIIESSACEKPIIASDVGALPEVVDDNITGYIFPSKNVDKLADKIEDLLLNPDKRISFGKAGREKVIREYEWKDCVELMSKHYKLNAS